VLRSVIDRLRAGRADAAGQTPGRSAGGFEQARIRDALARGQCPACEEGGTSDESFFFWFFNESYLEPESIDRLTGSLGFCRAHGDRLAHSEYGYELATVHLALTRRVLAGLAADVTGARATNLVSGLCPPCRDRKEIEDRSLFWLLPVLEDPSEAACYGAPGLLCFPHFRAIVPRLSRPTFERLLGIHATAVSGAQATLSALPAEHARLTTPLAMAVGANPEIELPPIEGSGLPRGGRDPVDDLLKALARGWACPVCLEARRAWIEWMCWLEAASRRGEDCDDCLPTCREHAWATVRRDTSDLALATARHVLRVSADALYHSAEAVRSSTTRRPSSWLSRAVATLVRPRPDERAREPLIHVAPCAICERLTVAEERTLSLLFALLLDPHHRAAVDAGYGLCLKHFVRALGLGPAPAIRKALLDIETAKLARLEWELEEACRKSGWQYRPEARGAETTAWRRALLKFSGSLTDGC
jgi:hypothetical protein